MNKISKIPCQFKYLNNHKQKGVVLILFVFLTLLLISSVLVSRLDQSKEGALQNKIQINEYNAKILTEAKAALVGYATRYSQDNGYPPGYLPCPNTGDLTTIAGQNMIGTADSSCPSGSGAIGKNAIGCLPWKTLGSSRLKDSFGNDLWYAVSGNYKYSPRSLLTPDSNGQLALKDKDNNVIAVIIIPGLISPTLGGDINCEQVGTYLTDSNLLKINSNTDWVFNGSFLANMSYQLDSINQQSYTGVYTWMYKWVATNVKACLNEYAKANGGKYPWLASLKINGSNLDYSSDSSNGGQRFGRVPNNVTWTDDNSEESYLCKNSTNCVCFNDSTSTSSSAGTWKGWWYAWREMVFVAINKQYAPDSSDIYDNNNSSNLKLNDIPAKFVVVVGGRKIINLQVNPQINQQRTTLSNKIDYANYLEGNNISTFKQTSGNENISATNEINYNNQITSNFAEVANDFAICEDYPTNIYPKCP